MPPASAIQPVVSLNLDCEAPYRSDFQVYAAASTFNGKALCVLYIFAGAERKCDLRESLEALQTPWNFLLYMREVDLVRGEDHDVCNQTLWDELMATIEQGQWDVVLCTPPCHTHSRSRNSYRYSPGPRPVRSLEYPFGFPWLTGKNLRACNTANIFIDKTVQALSTAFRAGSYVFCEHPEDLGVAANSENPASIWQLDSFHELLAESSASTWALFQCKFQASTSKPTRLFSNLPKATEEPFQGWPYFDAQRRYLGPLPHVCPHGRHGERLVGRNKHGAFKTAASAAYPADMCKWLALLIVESIQTRSLKRGVSINDVPLVPVSLDSHVVDTEHLIEQTAEQLTEQVSSDEDEDGLPRPKTAPYFGNLGPPLQTFWDGKQKPFTDGLGLCSPCRWHPSNRGGSLTSEQSTFIKALADIIKKHVRRIFPKPALTVMSLAVGKIQTQPCTEEDLNKLREEWFALLPQVSGLRTQPQFQPFYLVALAQSLKAMGDPDWKILAYTSDSYSTGVPVGVNHKMPRVPAVFDRKTKLRVFDESETMFDMLNYKSAEVIADTLETQFAEEEKLGFMYPTSLALAQQQFPGDTLRIAAQGAVQKPDGSWRALHDATHGVKVNNAIKVRDQVKFPGPAEPATIMEIHREILQACISASRRIFQKPIGVCYIAPRIGGTKPVGLPLNPVSSG